LDELANAAEEIRMNGIKGPMSSGSDRRNRKRERERERERDREGERAR